MLTCHACRSALIVCVLFTAGCTGPLGTGWGNAGDIHRGAWRGDTDLIAEAAARGEDPNARASFPCYDFKVGRGHTAFTPIELAIRNDKPNSIRALAGAGWQPVPENLLRAAYKGPRVTQAVLDAGAPVNSLVRDPWYELVTPLHAAAAYNIETCRVLLTAGANSNARDSYGRTPLHVAAQHSAELCRLLLAAGADPNLVDQGGKSALYSAISAVPRRNDLNAPFTTPLNERERALACVRELLLAGADPDLADRSGETPAQMVLYWPGEPGAQAFDRLIRETRAARTTVPSR